MCNSIVRFFFAAVLVATVTVNPAAGQYAPAANPAQAAGNKAEIEAAKTAAAVAQAEATAARKEAGEAKTELSKQQRAVQAAQANADFARSRANQSFGTLATLFVIAALALLVVFVILPALRRRKENKPEDTKTTTEHEEPAKDDDKHGQHGFGLVGMMAVLALVALLLFPLVAQAGSCYVTAVGKTAGDAKLAVLVQGQANAVTVVTDATSIQLLSGAKPVSVMVAKVAGGFTFTYSPAAPAELRVVSGQVTVCRLYVNDAYGAWTAHMAVQTVRPEIQEAKEAAGAAKDAALTVFAKTFGSDGKGGLAATVNDHERRITALERRPAQATPTVDLSAYDKKITELERQVRTANQVAAAASQEATAARALAEKLGAARVRTGMFRSQSLAEAAEKAAGQ